ncbi:MAG: hypothetical protein WC807_20710 [Hyphomicrobium sp.]
MGPVSASLVPALVPASGFKEFTKPAKALAVPPKNWPPAHAAVPAPTGAFIWPEIGAKVSD